MRVFINKAEGHTVMFKFPNGWALGVTQNRGRPGSTVRSWPIHDESDEAIRLHQTDARDFEVADLMMEISRQEAPHGEAVVERKVGKHGTGAG